MEGSGLAVIAGHWAVETGICNSVESLEKHQTTARGLVEQRLLRGGLKSLEDESPFGRLPLCDVIRAISL